MQKIKLLTGMSGDRFSYAPGDVVEMDDEQAARFVAAGLADKLDADGNVVAKAETAVAPGVTKKAVSKKQQPKT
jgi:hypothetical protein